MLTKTADAPCFDYERVIYRLPVETIKIGEN
jgi:hypothetical protein